jgi:two-component system phosphate regulon response regulator OmpR
MSRRVMEKAGTILVVEDEDDLREGVADYLRLHNFIVTPCANGREMEAALTGGGPPPDVALMDINLPGESGLDLARRLQALPQAPAVIMVTALGTTMDRVLGLELGADDYVVKPFETRELLARVRSVLRRRGMTETAPGPAATPGAPPAAVPDDGPPPLRFAGFTLDLARRRLLDPAGLEIGLTAMEFDLLRTLAERPNRVLSRDQLLELAHGKEIEPFDRSIDIRITRLRRKLNEDPASPRLIRTIRGAGYMFSPGREPG